MNVTELYERLVTAGILPRGKANADCKNKEEANSIKPVDFSQPGLVALLHSGIPCSSCGVRFPAEERIKCRQHLDWHFRQNRRLKDSGANQSRGWYFSVSDWMQYEEIEDSEEAGPCWFEWQRAANVADTKVEDVPSVSEGENPDDEICIMCHDRFKKSLMMKKNGNCLEQ
ncbi:hypothetical protein B7P43_G10416 [Cryptotermes secundus]|uniref:Pcf11 Clp1-ID domain-containing protein n=1 Tax=Cryptotermes secundus TaxID=105785 RepID=A0A2J7QEM8_9NEOP|nr:hypothetical protein B7P43_G10416 [Cryptotermes secundus]